MPKKKTMPLWLKMIVGLVAGLVCGLAASTHGLGLIPQPVLVAIMPWVMLPAKLFMALIAMIVIPLVFCSVLLAVTGGGSVDFFRSAGLRVAGYFVATTVFAVTLGMTLFSLIRPERFVPEGWAGNTQHTVSSALDAMGDGKSIPDMIVSLIPLNPAAMVLNQEMLQIVVAGVIAGLALLVLPQTQSRKLTDLCDSIQAVCMKVVDWTMLIVPVAVFGFLFRLAAETGPEVLGGLAAYITTVLVGLVGLLSFYLTMVTVVARRHPVKFLKDIRAAMVLAFSSSSSAATMPLSLEVAQDNLKVRPEIARLVIPLGATINMDGTALYQVIVALFLCGMLGIDLSAGQMAVLAITIVGASIGSPGTPGVGLVILAGILAKMGVPAESIGIILSVDRLLDMCRTTVNVTGDLTATAVMERLVKKKK